MSGNYLVRFEPFAEKHFIHSFEKKYKKHWPVTLRALINILERIDQLINTSRAETICDVDGIKIVKVQFRVDRSKESAKTSGNRCVVAWNEKNKSVVVLLVYSKTDISGHNETAEWQKIIKKNYTEYQHLF